MILQLMCGGADRGLTKRVLLCRFAQNETFTAKTDTNEKEVTARVEQFGMKLAHQFPWSPASKVAVGLALRRRFLSDPDAPSKLTRRKQIMEVGALLNSEIANCVLQSKALEQAQQPLTGGLHFGGHICPQSVAWLTGGF